MNMKKFLLVLSFLILSVLGASAQNVTCATRPVGDNSNACASTAFVNHNAAPGIITGPALLGKSTSGSGAVTSIPTDTSVFPALGNPLNGANALMSAPSSIPANSAWGANSSGVLQLAPQVTLSIMDYGTPGSVCTGSSHDSTVFQAAVTAIAGIGSAQLDIPSGFICKIIGISFSGSGRLAITGHGRSSELFIDGSSGDMFAATAGQVVVEGITVIAPSSGVVTSGYFFHFTGADGQLDNVRAENGFSIAKWDCGASGHASTVFAEGLTGDGFDVDVSCSISGNQFGIISFNQIKFQGLSNNNGIGLDLTSGDTILVSNSNIAGFKVGVNGVTSSSHSYLANLFFTNVLVDGAGGPSSTFGGWHFDGTNQYLGRIFISNSWASGLEGPSAPGYFFKNIKTIEMSNDIAINNGVQGMDFETGVRDVLVSNSTVSANSTSNPNNFDGILVGPGANNFIFTSNRSGPTYNTNDGTTFADTQQCAINILDPSTTNYTIENNNLTGNHAGPLCDGGGGTLGTTKFIGNNQLGAAVP